MFWTSAVCIILNNSSNTKVRLFLNLENDVLKYFVPFSFTSNSESCIKALIFVLKPLPPQVSTTILRLRQKHSVYKASASDTLTDGIFLLYSYAKL